MRATVRETLSSVCSIMILLKLLVLLSSIAHMLVYELGYPLGRNSLMEIRAYCASEDSLERGRARLLLLNDSHIQLT